MKGFWRLLDAVGAVLWFVMFVAYVATDYEPRELSIGFSLLAVSFMAARSAVKR